ncbi:sugar ABC transporter ATP-binding protein, partial [Escherichia coli]
MVSSTTPSSGEYLLEMSGINKSFPGVKALDNVNLKVRPHSIHALMGENGAGKSTLLKCLFGIYQKDSGTILFQGKEIDFHSAKEALENGISMVQEVNHLFTIIRKLKERGCGIVYISHKMEEIFQLCDEVTVLRDGQWIATEPLASFDLHKGEILGIAGLVGAKRTDIVETLFGIREKSAGTITLHGKKINNHNANEAINHGFALVT